MIKNQIRMIRTYSASLASRVLYQDWKVRLWWPQKFHFGSICGSASRSSTSRHQGLHMMSSNTSDPSSSSGSDGPESASISMAYVCPLTIYKKVQELRMGAQAGWLQDTLRKCEESIFSKLEHLIKAALGQQSSIANTQGGPSSQQGVQALAAELPPNLAAEQAASHERKRKRDTEPSKVLAEKKAQAGRRKKKKGRHTWKVEEVIQLQDAMIEAARKFREPKFGAVARRFGTTEEAVRRKVNALAKSLPLKSDNGQNQGQQPLPQSEAPMPMNLPRVAIKPEPPSPTRHELALASFPRPQPRVMQAVAAAAAPSEGVTLKKKRVAKDKNAQAFLKSQIKQVMAMAGGEGTVDEVVEELMVEKHWAGMDKAELRKRVSGIMQANVSVAALVSGVGGSGFESTRRRRVGDGPSRVIYRLTGE